MTDAVTVTTVVRADPAAAFEIFTREIDRWWSRGPLYRDREVMRFEGGRLLKGEAEIGRVLAWEPGVRLVMSWQEGTEVEVRFTAVGDGTRVTLEHRGLPQRGEAYRSQVGLWWGRLLTAYRGAGNAAGRAATGLDA
jgi:uncharacterized protein YndB with AHSA1/START domain